MVTLAETGRAMIPMEADLPHTGPYLVALEVDDLEEGQYRRIVRSPMSPVVAAPLLLLRSATHWGSHLLITLHDTY